MNGVDISLLKKCANVYDVTRLTLACKCFADVKSGEGAIVADIEAQFDFVADLKDRRRVDLNDVVNHEKAKG